MYDFFFSLYHCFLFISLSVAFISNLKYLFCFCFSWTIVYVCVFVFFGSHPCVSYLFRGMYAYRDVFLCNSYFISLCKKKFYFFSSPFVGGCSLRSIPFIYSLTGSHSNSFHNATYAIRYCMHSAHCTFLYVQLSMCVIRANCDGASVSYRVLKKKRRRRMK